MQHEITKTTDLLNQEGNIAEPGFAKKMLYNYNRENITAKKTRLKEWDYYYISNKEFALCLTISDMGFVGALSLTVMDFVTPAQFTNSAICLFPMGKFNMPRTSEKGDCSFKIGKVEMKFENDGEKRHLTGVYPNADKFGTDVKWDVVITDVPEESMVIATPFNKPGHFYYNQKINCLRAKGEVTYDGRTYVFDPEDSFAVLDWGRGVWTYHNTWYWGSASGAVDGVPFGWNIGYGFGDTSAASENMLFYNGKAHKLSQVKFNIPGNEKAFLEPWTFTSDDGRFEMDFKPVLDRASCTDALLIKSDQHQVFGLFTGKAVLDDGKVIEIKDFPGFAEKVENKW